MVNRGQLVLGSILVLLGLMLLVGSIFRIDMWAFCWPTGLILLGVWLVLRPTLTGPDKGSEVVLLGDIRRRGVWNLADQTIWLGIGDVDLDLTQAVIPAGETQLNLYGFVGDVDIFMPRSMGYAIRANGFVVHSDLEGEPTDNVLVPLEATSANYVAAEQRLRIEMTSFVADIKIRQV